MKLGNAAEQEVILTNGRIRKIKLTKLNLISMYSQNILLDLMLSLNVGETGAIRAGFSIWPSNSLTMNVIYLSNIPFESLNL